MRLGTLAVLFVVLLAGCGSTSPPRTAEDVTKYLSTRVPTSKLTKAYNAEDDPNRLLGRPNGYLSKTAFSDSRVRNVQTYPPDAIERGGSVEVFADEAGATARRTYIKQIAKAAPILGTEYQYQVGPVLLRVSKKLTPNQAQEYEAALTDLP